MGCDDCYLPTDHACRPGEDGSRDRQYTGHINQISCPQTVFEAQYTVPIQVCDEASRSLNVRNAGGKSEVSEMYSIDLFAQHFNGSNFIYEMQVMYCVQYSMVDFICDWTSPSGIRSRVGVSVTRAMNFFNQRWSKGGNVILPEDSARRLLTKKIRGLVLARNNVDERQSFYECVLHVWCETEDTRNLLLKVIPEMNLEEVRVMLTVCPDPRIYLNIR